MQPNQWSPDLVTIKQSVANCCRMVRDESRRVEKQIGEGQDNAASRTALYCLKLSLIDLENALLTLQ